MSYGEKRRRKSITDKRKHICLSDISECALKYWFESVCVQRISFLIDIVWHLNFSHICKYFAYTSWLTTTAIATNTIILCYFSSTLELVLFVCVTVVFPYLVLLDQSEIIFMFDYVCMFMRVAISTNSWVWVWVVVLIKFFISLIFI